MRVLWGYPALDPTSFELYIGSYRALIGLYRYTSYRFT